MKNIKIFFRKKSLVVGSLGLLITLVIFFLYQFEKPSSLNGMLRKGDELVQSGKLALALKNYSKIVRIYPESYDAHLRFGDLYLKLAKEDKETKNDYLNKAKIEYFWAMKLGNTYKYDANLALTNLYILQNNYDLAEETLLELKDIKNKETQEQIGNFYSNWARKLLNKDPVESIRKYKLAYFYYKKIDKEQSNKISNQIDRTYAKIADKLLESQNENEAVKILNLSISFDNSPLAHYKLAEIYENAYSPEQKNIDKAIAEYNKAFKLNPIVASSDNYINLLFKKADILTKQGNHIAAELLYKKIKAIKPNIHIPNTTDKYILINITSTKYNIDPEKDLFIPGISFKVRNIGKDKVNYLKVKVVFLKDNKTHYSEVVKQIVSSGSPLIQDKTTPNITIFSQKSMNGAFVDHNVKIQVFLSQKNPDEWRLFQSAILKNKKSMVETY